MGIRTGVTVLDAVMPYGLPERSVMLISGPLGSGKSVLGSAIVAGGLRSGFRGVIVAIDDLAESYVDILRRSGVDVDEEVRTGKLVLVDGFYAPVDVVARFKANSSYVHYRLSGVDGYSLIRDVAELAPLLRRSVVLVDSLNETLVRSPNMVFDIFRALKVVAYSSESIILATVHSDVEEAANTATLAEHVVDGTIQIDMDPQLEERGIRIRRLRIYRMKGLPTPSRWMHFEVVDGQVVGFSSEEAPTGLTTRVFK